MRNLWELPETLTVGGTDYPIRADFRDVLEVFGVLQEDSLPLFLRWLTALQLFYAEQIPQPYQREAMERMAEFFRAGYRETKDAPALLDWRQDAPLIAADINRVAGQELRAMPFVHWWTFLGWFHCIGEGQLSMVVSIRDKLHRGKKLEEHERAFYRANRALVERKKPLSAEEQAQKEKLQKMLEG